MTMEHNHLRYPWEQARDPTIPNRLPCNHRRLHHFEPKSLGIEKIFCLITCSKILSKEIQFKSTVQTTTRCIPPCRSLTALQSFTPDHNPSSTPFHDPQPIVYQNMPKRLDVCLFADTFLCWPELLPYFECSEQVRMSVSRFFSPLHNNALNYNAFSYPGNLEKMRRGEIKDSRISWVLLPRIITE